MIGSRRKGRREPTFDKELPVVAADVAQGTYTPTETIAVIQDETMLLEDPEREPAPEPEPEPLPEAGYVVLPTLWAQWPHLFGRVPALLEPADSAGDAPEQDPEPLFPQPYPISDSQVIAIYGGGGT